LLRTLRAHKSAAAFGVLLGLLPIGLAVMLSLREGFRVQWFALAWGETQHAPMGLVALLRTEIGYVQLALSAASLVCLTTLRGDSRRLGFSLLALTLFAALAIRVQPSQAAVAVLVLVATVAVAAVFTMSTLIAKVYTAPIPFARASALMMLIAICVAPLKILDESQSRTALRGDAPSHAWEEWAFDDIAEGALMLLADPRMYARARAAQASGTMRPDIDVLPIFALDAPSAQAVIAREPKLTALLRDMLLTGAPLELSMSELSAARPLIVEFGPRWDRALARHLIPTGLFMRYETEPRGLSERRAALERQLPLRDRMATLLLSAKEPELLSLTVRTLRIRAIAMALTGERESTSRALDDLRTFAPKDPMLEELVRRVVLAKGPIDVTNLDPSR
jgi:hypothetical protein